MTDVQQRTAAKHFAEYWKGKGYEKGQSQAFWLSLLSDVFDVEHAAEYDDIIQKPHFQYAEVAYTQLCMGYFFEWTF